jgi:hypothetical protein
MTPTFDMSNLTRIGSLEKLAPQAMAGFRGLDAAALAPGASEAELAETVFVAAAVRAGAALTHGTHLFAETR